MLSNPLHRYSTYNAMSSNMLTNSRLPSQNHNGNLLHSSGLDHLAHGSQHALQQLQQNINLHQNVQRNNSRHRQHPYHGMSGIHTGKPTSSHGSSSGGPVRRRISRACDQCNQLRTKCDGQGPCAHCVEFGLGCEYIRERKKRGKASRKDLAAQQAAAAAGGGPKSPSGHSSDGRSPSESRAENLSSNNSSMNDAQETHRSESGSSSLVNDVLEGRVMEQEIGHDSYRASMRGGRLEIMTEFPLQHQPQILSHRAGSMTGSMTSEQTDSPIGLGLTGYSALHGYGRPATNAHLLNGSGSSPSFQSSHVNLPGYADLPYSMQSPSNYPGTSAGSYRIGESPLGFSMNDSPGPSPGWMSLPSPSATQYTPNISQQAFNTPSRYPVLQPLIPHLGTIVPVSLACDLLDLYFASSSSAQIHPMSPYVLGYVFRKRSFLHPTNPRTCSPALLASMLWVAAQTSDAVFLTAPPSARGRICQGLLELTVSLLKPLIHGPTPGDASPNFMNTVINGVALGGLGVSMSESSASELGHEGSAFGAAGALDDVVTYIHLATVVSASEYKGASLRWWNAAWSLARELKLGRELPPHATQNSSSNDLDADGESDTEDSLSSRRRSNSNALSLVTEEEREERRRIWWLVYIVDRHLSLCYNKPLFLLDSECESLLQPMDDSLFQSGNFDQQATSSGMFESDPNQDPSLDCSGYPSTRRRGPGFECTGHSIFGYFLPLMTILGEIVDLKMARNHPRFGTNSRFRSAQEWENQSAEITRQLEAYGRSLVEFEKKHLGSQEDSRDDASQAGVDHAGEGSVHSAQTSSSFVTSSAIRTRTVLAYSTHVMHVLHILLTGKWDPISLLDDADLWISSESFITSTSHAVSAAEAINSILEWDEGLEFMPFFFGVYLLQGSFLLLLIADKLGVEASARVIGACEGVVRAIEACVVTLNTEYQRNFRKVMRSALAQVRGRCPEDWVDQQKRRREVLMLYRWTPDGTGLAL